MEAVLLSSHSQPLISIESFSYRWLLNLNPSTFEFDFDHVHDHDQDQDQDQDQLPPENSSFRLHGSSLDFIEMDPRLPASRRFFVRAGSHDFNFAFPFPPNSSMLPDSPPLVHADQLISDNGILMPLFINPLKQLEDQETDSSPAPSCDHIHVSRKVKPSPKIPCSSNYSKRFFLKYFAFLVPFCKKICNHRRPSISISRSGSSRVEAVNYSSSSSCDNRRRSSCDSESSIHEAVLHCKRSINGTKFE